MGMKIPQDRGELKALFRKLGAPSPERWAQSQHRESIPQLARFLFLREAWKLVRSEQDVKWIDIALHASANQPNDPYSGVGTALLGMMKKGVNPAEINELVRGEQAKLLSKLLSLLDGPERLEPEVEELCWGLFVCDDEGTPAQQIGGLHESFLGTDPTGREMRPIRPNTE